MALNKTICFTLNHKLGFIVLSARFPYSLLFEVQCSGHRTLIFQVNELIYYFGFYVFEHTLQKCFIVDSAC